MVYETAANIRTLLSLDSANFTDAKILVFQTQADALIDEVNASPNALVAAQIETDMVYRLIARSKVLNNYGKNGLQLDAGLSLRPIFLSSQQVELLRNDNSDIDAVPMTRNQNTRVY